MPVKGKGMVNKYRRGEDREELLADVAEMYYEQNQTQSEIAQEIGMTRSAISRMLTEAQERGIVDIRIQRPLRFDEDLAQALVARFRLKGAHVLVWKNQHNLDLLRKRLGEAAAGVLKKQLLPGITLGIAWGTTVSATIEALQVDEPLSIKVVQLVGVLGSTSHVYNAQALVEMMAQKVRGEAVYLYTPFIVESADTVRALMNTYHVHEAIELGKRCDIALLGIGTTIPEHSSLYLGGHISLKDLQTLRQVGAVGDVSGHHYDILGCLPAIDFHERLVGIAREDLLAIPVRLGVSGGRHKAEAILGALRGGYINTLVTDSATAALVLEQ
jgi:DNA-binding transcriptional regulator LsrR (DeoR family)